MATGQVTHFLFIAQVPKTWVAFFFFFLKNIEVLLKNALNSVLFLVFRLFSCRVELDCESMVFKMEASGSKIFSYKLFFHCFPSLCGFAFLV